ncbi:MAG: GPW/gp25 family protein [bacterium]
MSDDFLGRGVRFPFSFNVAGATDNSRVVAVSEKFDHINESIRQILGTSPGERVMLPEFGSRLKELVFEPSNTVLKALAKVFVVDALKRWEKRIVVQDVQISEDSESIDNGVFAIHISYMVIKNQALGNLVFPFYVGKQQ